MELRTSKTIRNGRTYAYAQLVQSIRGDDGKPTKRVLAHLGTLTALEVQNLKLALAASRGNRALLLPESTADQVEVLHNFTYLDVAVVLAVWRRFALDKLLTRIFPLGDKEVCPADVVASLVVQRCIRPRSKLHAVHWFPKTALPELTGISPGAFNNTRIHRVLEALDLRTDARLQDALREHFAVRQVVSSVVFIDLTDTWFVGQGAQLAEPARTKEGLWRRKVGIALACNDDGFPLRWSVVQGRQAEPTTILQMLQTAGQNDWVGSRPVVCDRAMGVTEYLQRMNAMDVRFLTALKRTEFDAYTDRFPTEALAAVAVDTAHKRQDAEGRAADAVAPIMNRIGKDLFVLDLGIITRDALASVPPSPSRTEDKTVTVMRMVQTMEQQLRQDPTLTCRELGRPFGLKKQYTARLRGLLGLCPDLRTDVLAGGAAGLSLAILLRLARQSDPVKQRTLYNAARDKALRRSDSRTACPRRGSTPRPGALQVRAVVTFNPRVFVDQRLKAAQTLCEVESAVRALGRSEPDIEALRAKVDNVLREAQLKKVYTPQITSQPDGQLSVTLQLDQAAWQRRRRFDGFQLLVAHPELQMDAAQLARLYRQKDQVEKDFQTIKSVLYLRPLRHRTDTKVRAHVTLCILALLVQRIVEKQLRDAGQPMSAHAALESFETVHLNLMDIPRARGTYKLTRATADQRHLLHALGLDELLDPSTVTAAIHPR
jgi:hypothetical protein